MDTFNYMRAFRRIVELGSLAKAAEDLDMSSAGLSKQLRALEAHLGAVLIQRTTRKMSLTDTGAAYYAECCRLLDALDALEKSVKRQSGRVSGRLRVNAPVSFALSVLSPLLARFLRQYPELRLDLAMEDRLACARHDDTPRIDIEGMRGETFDYPSGLAGALACQAAHLLAGEAGHWDLFDAIQRAHLSEHRNVGDTAVLLDIAAALGFDRPEFARVMQGEEARRRVREDRAAAARLGIDSIPTLVAGPHQARLQTLPLADLRDRLLALMPARA
ncbi:LysR family transcriptional regulator [Achromobacter xylosoxidans]